MQATRITCALLDDHTVKCWGNGQNGQLGLGNTLDVGDGVGPSVAAAGVVAVARPDANRSIVTGDAHTCALFDDGAVACWGDGGFGRLGNANTDTIGNSSGEMGADLATVDLGSERTATALAAGERHTCALLDDASVKCWGSGADGRLGSGSTDDIGDGSGQMGDALQPVDFGLGRSALAIAAGEAHTCALLDDLTVTCWGAGADGRLGYDDTDNVGDGVGSTVASAGAVGFGGGRTAQAVVAGGAHTCALLDDFSVTCWGSGGDGRLGYEDTDNVGDGIGVSTALAGQVDLGSGRTALAVAAGGEHTCALLDDVTVTCWGSGGDGQLGYDDTANVGDGVGASVASAGAVDFGAGRNAVALTAGDAHTCALLDDVTVACWGDGDSGRLGYGNTGRVGNGAGPSVATAGVVELVAGRTAQAVAAGGAHTCVLLDDESIQCWGRGSSGRLGYENADNIGDGSGPSSAAAGTVELSSPMPVVASLAPAAVATVSSVTSDSTSGSAVVTWTAPLDDGGTAVVGYRIEQSVNGISWSDAIANTGTTATSAALTGLSVDVDHRFRVSAINAVGRSPQSAPSAVFVPTAPPTVSIALAAGQPNPAPSGAIRFTVTFDQPVTGLATADLTVGGSAGATAATVSGSGATYTATVLEPAAAGTVTVSVDASMATNANGQLNTASNTATVTFAPVIPEPEPDAFVSLAPERFVDTRANGETLDDLFEKTGKREAGSEYRVRLAGRGDVPEGAVAVIANVTAVGAEGSGFVTAHPCVTPRPNASSLNYTSGVNLGNEIIAPLTASGDLCLFTAAATHFTVDVSGYVDADAPTIASTPARFLDTRANGETFDGESQRTGVPGAGASTTLQITGRNGIPADAAAVIVNVTAIQAATGGFVTVHPCAPTPPLASSLNHVAGVNRANEIIATLDGQGRICLFTSAATHLAADVVGYLPAGSNLAAVGPSRLFDTRAAGQTVDGANQGEGALEGGNEYVLQVAGRPGVAADATTAVVNVTAVRAIGGGFITIHPCLTTRPNASSLNYVQGVNGGNEVITQLDANGRICIYTQATTQITVDIVAAS